MTSDGRSKPNRVWTNPRSEKDKPSLVFLKPEALCSAVVPADDLETTAAAVADGDDVVAQNIPLTTIAQLQGQEGGCDLSVTYQQGREKTGSIVITLADGAKRDELLGALRERLGQDWIYDRQRVGRLSACSLPLGVMAGIAFVTLIMYGEAKGIAAGEVVKPGGSPKSRMMNYAILWVESLIGASGVLILGGILAGLGFVWLVYAVARPPFRFTVRPGKA